MNRVPGLVEQGDASESVLVQMLRQLRNQQAQIAQLSLQLEKAQLSAQINFSQKQREKNNSSQSNTSQPSRDGTPSPLMMQQQQIHAQRQTKPSDEKKYTNTKEDDEAADDKQAIKEEIVEEVEDLTAVQKPLDNDVAQVSGGISSSGANAIDHSIDTLQLDQYDYVEEVRQS